MPIIKSAKKRVRVAQTATVRNIKTKRSLRAALKDFSAAVANKSPKTAKAHQAAQSALDQAAKKGVFHKNKVARKQRQLAAAAKSAGVKPTPQTTKKASSAKPTTAPKKSAPVKSRKPTTKTVAKKPSTKKR